MPDGAWLVVLTFWMTCLVVIQVGLRFVVTYDIAQREMRVLLFRVVRLSTIQLSDVASVEVLPFRRLLALSMRTGLFWAARAGNRLYARRLVVIRRRAGRGRAVIISPDDPDEFARRLAAANVSGRIT